jgi:hypothetical protein
MHEPPLGNVTLLFTDIARSTRLWERDPEGMRDALARHHAILRAAIEAHGAGPALDETLAAAQAPHGAQRSAERR